MDHHVPHHLTIGPEHVAGNGDLGRLFFVPGSDARARRLSERFRDPTTIPSPRQLNVHLGQVEHDGRVIDVGAVATGMGCPSLDIVVTELIQLGARHFLRVGTSGSLQPERVRAGDLVIATAAVRDEGTSLAYVPAEYPAVADPDVVAAVARAAHVCGVADRTFRGVVHSKDSLFAREFGHGPQTERNRDYMRQLARMGVLATEMETAHLLVLSHVHSAGGVAPLAGRPEPGTVVRSGAILAIIGDDRPFVEPEVAARTEEAAVDVAVRAALELLSDLA